MTEKRYPQVRPLHVNRGGEIGEAEIVGRERELKSLVRTLESQSVLVAAERRIGKTTLCKQAQRQLSGESLALYVDIENVNSTGELAATLVKMVGPHLHLSKRWGQKTSALYRRMVGMKIDLPKVVGGGGFTLPPGEQKQWKEWIRDTIDDLLTAQVESKQAKKLVCLMLDEFPIALEKIRKAEGDSVAMDVLDLFRSLRTTPGTHLRFVFRGSIGIHHIVQRLQKQGYANDPMNDVFPLIVKALRHEDAQELALGLLLGEGISSPDYESAAKHIAEESSRVPFYIHHIVGDLRDAELEATEETIRQTIRNSIESPTDPWKLRNYKTRLERHFPENYPVAFALLDALSVHSQPSTFDDLCNLVRHKVTDANETIIGETLDLLEQDFYVERDGQSQTYHFLRPLLARAWRHIQHLPLLEEK